MKKNSTIFRILAAISALFLSGSFAYSHSFEQVRAMAAKAETTLAPGVTINGIIVSDYRSYNSENTPNTAWNKVDVSVAISTVYLQSEDGRLGFKLVLDNIYLNRFERGTMVEVDLGGATLVRSDEPQAYTILHPKAVRVLSTGNSPAVKTRKITDISDDDIYTLVTIEGVEYLNKQGSFLNVYELCTQKNHINRADATFRAADSWASMLLDGEGNHIYLQLNSKEPWRRNVLDFPKGTGSVTGIIVCSQNRRYGADFGRYSIRPIFRNDIAIAMEEASAYTPIASWRWDRNYHEELNFVQNGKRRWLNRRTVQNDAVKAETGNGILYTTTPAFYSLDTEYDARHATDGNGMGARAAGALRLDCNTSDWYIYNGGKMAGTNSIIVETSTAGVTGNGLTFNFSMLAGNHSVKYSYGFPAYWTVTYSIDGRKWYPTGFNFALKPIAYKRALYEKAFYPTSYDAAMGFPEFSIKLPAALLGKEKIYIRISPANDILTGIYTDPAKSIASEKMAPGYEHPCCIRIGMVELKTF